MTQYDFDLFVIGGGSGGVRAGRIAATHGARVGVAEERYMGGTCVNVGCIPKKLLAYSAGFGRGFEDAAGYGWTCSGNSFSWQQLIRNKDVEIDRIGGVYRAMMENAGVKVFDARGVLADAHTVALSTGERFSAERMLIATGGWPKVPDIPGKELAITSNEAFHLPQMPRRVLVVGGGYIAVEFAGIFSGLGAEVTLIHRGMAILTAFDHELGEQLMHEMHEHGIKTHLLCVIKRLERTADGIRAVCNDDRVLEADCVLYATGRTPLTHGIGLEALGVALDSEGAIVVDEDDRTNVPHIFAIGDVTNQLNLTPVATAKGQALAERLYAGGTRRVSLENVATAIFSSPPIATVGLSEQQAAERGIAVDVFKQRFRPLKHRLSLRNQWTFMKLIVARASDRVIGCHVIGDDAAEMLQGFAVAIVAGATKTMFDQTIGIHPTSAEEFVTMRTPVRIQIDRGFVIGRERQTPAIVRCVVFSPHDGYIAERILKDGEHRPHDLSDPMISATADPTPPHDLYARARFNMVESQIRTNRVTDPRVLAAMMRTPRQIFVPGALAGVAYVDKSLRVAADRYLLEPLTLARLLQEAMATPADRALVIGAGTGYSTAVLADLTASVTAVESDPDLADTARANLAALALTNALVQAGPLDRGWAACGPYDVILIDGMIAELPDQVAEQIADQGRLVTIVSREGRCGAGMLYRKLAGSVSGRVLFDAAGPFLPGFEPRFAFTL